MAKPILIVGFPLEVGLDEMSTAIIPIDQRLSDYHVIAYRASNIDDLNFKVLNSGESSDLDIEALKKEVEDKIFNKNS